MLKFYQGSTIILARLAPRKHNDCRVLLIVKWQCSGDTPFCMCEGVRVAQ